MVTGLAIGKDIGGCDVCNFSLNWIVENPSILLWADKIILTPTMWDTIINKNFPKYRNEFSESIKILFQMAESENIIQVMDPSKIISNSIGESIEKQVKSDMQRLTESFPGAITFQPELKLENGKTTPDELRIMEYEYCSANLVSIYGGLMLSRAWGAQCLFDNRSFEYCKYRFGLEINNCQNNVLAFRDIFSAIMPNEKILPEIAVTNEKHCDSCVNKTDCKKKYLTELEATIGTIFTWRKYDEIMQVKSIMEKVIVESIVDGNSSDHRELILKYHEKERMMKRKIRSTFPKIKRFANITTLVSLPFAVLGAATGATLITVAGLSVAAFAQAGKEIVELMQSKNNWVGFTQNKIE